MSKPRELEGIIITLAIVLRNLELTNHYTRLAIHWEAFSDFCSKNSDKVK